MNETKNYVIRLNKDHNFSPKTLPSLSVTHSPIMRSLSPSLKAIDGFSTRLEQLPSLSRFNSPRSQNFGRFLSGTRQPEVQQSRIISSHCGKVKIIAANTHAGTQNRRNEDRVKIILNLKKPVLFTEDSWPKSSYYAIYDGHDGKSSAEFLKENLHDFILLDKNFPYRLKESVIQGFKNTEHKLLDYCEEHNDFSGASAVVFIVIGNKCVTANLGDSIAILSADRGKKIVNLSREHKTFNEEERKRVEDMGGSLFCEYFIDEKGFKCEKGHFRVNPGGLQVTRCFGSPQVKFKKFGGIKGMILAEPDLKGFKIKENYDFVVLASSGFFDKLSIEDVVEQIWNGIDTNQDESLEKRVDSGIRQLIKYALEMRCEANLTIVLIGFKNLARQLDFGV